MTKVYTKLQYIDLLSIIAAVFLFAIINTLLRTSANFIILCICLIYALDKI